MSNIARAISLALLFPLFGCAIRPLPEDVTGVSTYVIVRQIRCETRQAIIDSALGWLMNQEYDMEARRIGAEFANGSRPIQTFSYTLFRHERINRIIHLFYETGIAYNYQLTMTETSDLGAGIDLENPFSANKFTVGFGSNFNRYRQNLRTFTVTDTFSGLIRDVPDDYCQDYVVQENHVYPITGRIGMESMVQDFIRLTLFGNLSGGQDDPKGPPTLVDSLEFQTLIDGSASPTIVFASAASGLNFTKGFLTWKASRKDNHKVTVGLAIDDGSLGRVNPLRGSLFGPLLTASGGNAEQLAAEAVNQALTLRIFTPIVTIQP